MRNQMKKNKGITLVALVITIIILLILAGVSISKLTGNGLFEKAKLAKNKEENAQELENDTLTEYEKNIDEFINGSNRALNGNFIDILKYLAKQTESSEYDNQINEIVNSEEIMNEICSTEDIFVICAYSRRMMEKICESSIARNAMYNNAEVTESILANSNIAIEAMKESSKYEVIGKRGSTSFVTLYENKAFVIGVSQKEHNGSVSRTMTHGQYILGNSTYTYAGGGAGYTTNGLGVLVKKFASTVTHKMSYHNSSGVGSLYAAILKID